MEAAHVVAGMLINPTEGAVLDSSGAIYRIIHLPYPFVCSLLPGQYASAWERARLPDGQSFGLSDRPAYARWHTPNSLVSRAKRRVSV